ncbi:hypothetical protein B4102_0688 [Heyndrickxia sporothermodurans]|uniref:Uncharacterized protein n=1 Tax=Heyndrickxia sporothermodurans TaxID=46224 RepID=A0A150L8E9_9BACI|nr:hypothetical protein B4102_0688 [Heyndrickxia sporothermodurans]
MSKSKKNSTPNQNKAKPKANIRQPNNPLPQPKDYEEIEY